MANPFVAEEPPLISASTLNNPDSYLYLLNTYGTLEIATKTAETNYVHGLQLSFTVASQSALSYTQIRRVHGAVSTSNNVSYSDCGAISW
jgi:hypothetical protein